jgi:TIGR03009 family protein
MNRRHALQRLLGGFAAGGLLLPSTLLGQAQIPVQQAAAGTQAPAPQPRGLPGFQIAPETLQVLHDWERYTRTIQKLEGDFERYVYDMTFVVEKRATGEFWYEAPDKGRIDFKPMNIAALPIDATTKRPYNPLKKGANGQFYAVQADAGSRWICRGDILLYIDDDQKTYESVEIPPHMRGQNITASPLPFLFGVSAAQMQERYYLALGSMHDPQGQRGKRVIHIVASPRLASIAKEWSRAEVLLDPGERFQANGLPVFVPTAIKLLDPTGNQETVYVFKLDDTKLNAQRWFGDPFKDPGILSGLKFLGHHRQAAEPQQAPTRDAEAPGRATVR